MVKKLISVVLIICIVLAVLSCGEHSDYSAENEVVTITYLTIGDKPTNGVTEEVVQEINKILLKKANARLDIFYVGWNDYLNNYNKVLESDDIDIDLVATSTDWLDAWPNVVKGSFLPLSREMLIAFCPKTYENVKDSQWEQCSYNGEVYFIPENEYTQWTNHGFVYRGDIASEAGLDEISSWGELTRYLQYVEDNKPNMIPWDSDGNTDILGLGYIMSVSKYNPIYEISTYGIWGAYSDKHEVLVSPYYEGEELINFARLMKLWKRAGVWRADLSNAGDNEKEFYEGITSLAQHHTQKFFTEIKPEMEIKNPTSNTKFYWFGKESGNLMRDSILHGAMAVYSKSKNPEKALMVYDILRNDEECYRLLRYGIEGEQYILTKEGMIEKPSGYNTDQDSFVTNFWWGRRDEYEKVDSNYAWSDYYTLLEQYDRVAIDYPWDGYNFASIINDTRTEKIVTIFDKYIYEISYGEYDISPEEEVALFREELKEAGFEEITGEIQKIIDEH